jgi:tetratricopeptide (TPR) repeat protein
MRPVRQLLVWPLLLVIMLTPRAWSHADLELQIEELTLQLERQPDNVEWLLKRGDLQRRHESYGLARNDFRRVREIQPDHKIVDWFEGRLEVESGRAEIGIKFLDRFLMANPDHGIALQNRAQAHLLLHQPLLAARDYQRVIQVSAKPAPSIYSSNAQALVDAGPEYFSEAMGVVRVGLERFPGEVSLTGLGTDIALAMSDLETAQELINTLPVAILGLPQWKARVALLDSRLSE